LFIYMHMIRKGQMQDEDVAKTSAEQSYSLVTSAFLCIGDPLAPLFLSRHNLP
jgi:hypothetical protein